MSMKRMAHAQQPARALHSPRTMIPFAETEQLYICGIEERDVDKVMSTSPSYAPRPRLTRAQIAALLDDPRVQRSKPVPVVLQADEWARTLRARGSIDGDAGMLACVLEAKAPRDADGKDGDRFVGLVELIPGHEVHRDSVFGIYLGAPDARGARRQRVLTWVN
jgi:hypothetical protein